MSTNVLKEVGKFVVNVIVVYTTVIGLAAALYLILK